MNKKDVGLRIRLDRDLRGEFVAACQVHDRPAAQVLREFMREYVRESDSSSPLKASRDKADDGPTDVSELA